MAEARIFEVNKDSIAAELGWQSGDVILRINGSEIGDIIDYQLLTADESVEVLVRHADGEQIIYEIEKDYDESLGVTFNPLTITPLRQCRNKCQFCFIDQMPPGHRPTLYVRDDDYRLSFVSGSYITGTNLSEADIERIIRLNLSPLYLSVHQTGPGRDILLGRQQAPHFDMMALLRRFAAGGILLHTQIVLCPGLNDGEHLHRTLQDLMTLMPSVLSIAVVPVGLTKYRGHLTPMKEYTPEIAASVIDTADFYAAQLIEEHGRRVIFCSDEIYIRAGREIPDMTYYETFAQYENGIGMIRLLTEEFEVALEDLGPALAAVPFDRPVVIATGRLAAPYLRKLMEKVKAENGAFSCDVVPVTNQFFGPTVTVAGLVTGGDVVDTLRDRYPAGTPLLIPRQMLQFGSEIFLDDLTVSDVAEQLQMDVRPVEVHGGALLEALIEKGGN